MTKRNLLISVKQYFEYFNKTVNPRRKGQIIDLVFKTNAAQPLALLIISCSLVRLKLQRLLNDRS